MKNLTKRQRTIFTYIHKRIKSLNPPTIREIATHFGVCDETIKEHLSALEKKKYIKREKGKQRAISITKPDATEIQIFGRVAAGDPILAVQNREGTLPIPTHMINENDKCFGLRVLGASMSGIGILDGDVVYVRQQATAENGDIVVAMVFDEATVKRFFLEGDRVRLHPENPDVKPIIANVRDVRIIGKVIGSFREFV